MTMLDDSDPDPADWNPEPATVRCPECLADVHEDAERCPECGHSFSPDQALAKKSTLYKLVIAIIVGLLVWHFVAFW